MADASDRDAGIEPGVRSAIEISIRLGAIGLMVVACLLIVAPFLGIAAWALIIAIGLDGPYESLCRWLGGRRNLAAIAIVTLALLILIIPAAQLSGTLITGAEDLARDLSDGSLAVPAPDPSVADWPIVGARIYDGWKLASENLAQALSRVEPQLQAVSGWLLRAAGGAGVGLLQLLASILIAGVMLARSQGRVDAIERFAIRMAGREQGPRLARLANATVRSVVQGILGVAFLQAVLGGIGFAVAGVPAAGLWALLILVAAVIQLPVALVMLPPVLYALSTFGGTAGVALVVWCIAVALLDNLLKPLLFGRGVEVPALVIFIGAIGGMLTMGIVGLFLGAVVLALGFALFTAWLSGQEEREPVTADAET